MANYYTEASFIIPCTNEQAGIALAALEEVDGELTDRAREAIAKADKDDPSEMGRIIRHCYFNHPEQDDKNPQDGLSWSFRVSYSHHDGGLWVRHNESINTEEAAVFAQAVLVAFDIPALVIINAAHTCDKERPDGFGGHACAVTKDVIRWGGLNDFSEAEEKAHADQARYFFCEITEVDGENEYTNKFLMSCAKGKDPDERFDEIFTHFRGFGEKEDDEVVVFEDGISVKDPFMSEITPVEFRVMQGHLKVL